jgi:hypothetical protein
MIVVKKKMKKPLIIAILAGALAVLTVAAILLNTFLLADNGSGTDNNKVIDYRPELGESKYNGEAVAYPHIDESRMEMIEVNGEYKYSFTRLESVLDTENESKISPFVLSYVDEFGNELVYAPNIMGADPTFSYEDTYATTTGTGLGTVEIYKLTYLCTALGTPYFNGRIELPEAYEAKEEMLSIYGLSLQDHPIKITFYYYDSEDNIQQVTLKIGEKVITGGGYYFTVDNRPYVYSSSNPYIEYALGSFVDYIKPLLVAEGLPQDNAFEPYLTTDFKQWKNTVYDDEGDVVLPDSTVIFTADMINARYIIDENGDKQYKLVTKDAQRLTYDLSLYKNDSMYGRFSTAFVGKAVGALSEKLAVTTYSFATPVTVGANGESVKYTYRIKQIESIITDDGEITTPGAVVGESNLVKVTYSLYLNDEMINFNDFSGILDLSSPLITDDLRALIKEQTIGNVNTPIGHIDVNLTYTDDTVVKNNVSIVITEIIDISDKDGYKINTVQDGAKVMFRYYTVQNGERSEGYTTSYITVSDDMPEDERVIADLLMGKTVDDGYNINVAVYNIDCEIMASYTTYMVSSVDYFYTKENIVSFAFVQASDRDVFYGESFYENTMEGKYSMYALNASACQAVVELLGGLNESATSSVGLAGLETVAIGITPEKLKKYGLYANTIYFELPRGITAIDYGDVPTDEFFQDLDDYTYYDTLGFTLYISDAGIDGKRYIASDMYDVISVVDADDFVFLDESFVDFYARRNIVLADISTIDKIKLEFFMDDVYGSYTNQLKHSLVYAYNGKLYRKEELTADELELASAYDAIDVLVTPDGECMDTAFSKYLAENGYTYDSLRQFFGGEFIDLDSRGTANFKEFTETLFFTSYQGTLTEAEQEAGFANGKLLMKMTVKLYDGYGAYQYAYEFYKISDRRIMVNIYRENIVDGTKQNAVSDFYVSTFAFEKLVGLYVELLNGNDISNKTAFVDIGKN